MKIYRILGQKGRITIPFSLRIKYNFAYNDVISFEEKDNSIVVKHEKVCDSCKPQVTDEASLKTFLDGLSLEEQREALIHLSLKWAHKSSGGRDNA
jgi:bifunctional DNA-binding transcriptional regulator/antitoxin component of YhaV-PrlF toxin-antitoxin module